MSFPYSRYVIIQLRPKTHSAVNSTRRWSHLQWNHRRHITYCICGRRWISITHIQKISDHEHVNNCLFFFLIYCSSMYRGQILFNHIVLDAIKICRKTWYLLIHHMQNEKLTRLIYWEPNCFNKWKIQDQKMHRKQ